MIAASDIISFLHAAIIIVIVACNSIRYRLHPRPKLANRHSRRELCLVPILFPFRFLTVLPQPTRSVRHMRVHRSPHHPLQVPEIGSCLPLSVLWRMRIPSTGFQTKCREHPRPCPPFGSWPQIGASMIGWPMRMFTSLPTKTLHRQVLLHRQ